MSGKNDTKMRIDHVQLLDTASASRSSPVCARLVALLVLRVRQRRKYPRDINDGAFGNFNGPPIIFLILQSNIDTCAQHFTTLLFTSEGEGALPLHQLVHFVSSALACGAAVADWPARLRVNVSRKVRGIFIAIRTATNLRQIFQFYRRASRNNSSSPRTVTDDCETDEGGKCGIKCKALTR